MKKHKNELILSIVVLLTLGFLIFIETQLPAFKKFIPVDENKLIVIILNINLLLILLLLFLVTRTLAKVYIEKKRGIWGSGLKKKLTLTLLFISVIPSFTLFILATGFFSMSMDKWFSQRIEDTIDSALGFAQFHYEDMFQRYEKTGRTLSEAIVKQKLLDNEAALQSYIRKTKRFYQMGYLAVSDLSLGRVTGEKREPSDAIAAKLAERARTSTKQHPIREIVPLKEGN